MMSVRVPIHDLEIFCSTVFVRAGASETHAAIAAEALATTDSWGVFTHGSKLLAGYARRLRAGGIKGDVEPEVVAEGPAWAILDGGSALGQVIGVRAMDEAVKRARQSGIAYVGVRRSNHFGAAGYYAARAAKSGLVGIAMVNDIPSVAAPGSRGAVTGTNPLAYAIPGGSADPILLDIAMSTVAGGKVYAASQLGRPIPDNWIVDNQGRPTTEASLYPHAASLAPMTGHKGYGLALLIESLSALATGAAMTTQVGSWMFDDPSTETNHGAAFLAIDVATMAGGAELFTKRAQALIDEIHAAPTADGVERLLLPGEREWANRRRALAEGIELPDDVVAAIAPIANELDLNPDWLPRKP